MQIQIESPIQVMQSDKVMLPSDFDDSLLEFKDWYEKTYLTDVTDAVPASAYNFDSVSNDDFLKVVFQTDSISEQDAILVCSKAGDPQASGWFPKCYPANVKSSKHNWYFAPSTFVPAEDRKYHSKSKYAKEIYCIVLDDVGQKVSFEKVLPCPPTWVIQTSPDSCQVGYAFEEGQKDFKSVEQLKDAFIAAGMSDPGATGASARWSRLPIGINGKPKYGTPSPQCKLIWWKPNLKYSVSTLMTLLSLREYLQKSNSDPEVPLLSSDQDRKQSDFIDENPVITKLKTVGLYKSESSTGIHEITCPWISEHTDQTDSGTAYFEPSKKFRLGGFKCHHSHGGKFRIKEFLDFLGISISEAKNLPTITVYPGDIPKIVDSVEFILAETNKFYVRGGTVVSLHRDEVTSDLEVRISTRSSLVRTVSQLSIWEKKAFGKYIVCDPPNKYIDLLLDGQDFSRMLHLKSIARQPFFRPSGGLVIEPGYDIESGVYCDFVKSAYEFDLNPQKIDG